MDVPARAIHPMYQPVMTQNQLPVILLQVVAQLNALDMAYKALDRKCETAATSLTEEQKRRAKERARCDEREEELQNQLLEQKKVLHSTLEDKRWVEELMSEAERRYNDSKAKWQEELNTCKNNRGDALEQIKILKNNIQSMTMQLNARDAELEGISHCLEEKQVLVLERNNMAEALRLFDTGVKNQALLKAAREGRATAVRALVNVGTDINVKDPENGNYKRTPLHWAATEGHVEVMKVLVALGADPRYDVDSDVYTLLHSAARYGRPHVVRYLLDGKWIPVDATFPSRKETALHLASRHGHTEVVEMLLAAGAAIDARNYRGSTPLHMAAWNGRTSASFTLVNHGASLTLTDIDGNAYQNAQSQGHFDIARFIKSKME